MVILSVHLNFHLLCNLCSTLVSKFNNEDINMHIYNHSQEDNLDHWKLRLSLHNCWELAPFSRPRPGRRLLTLYSLPPSGPLRADSRVIYSLPNKFHKGNVVSASEISVETLKTRFSITEESHTCFPATLGTSSDCVFLAVLATHHFRCKHLPWWLLWSITGKELSAGLSK